jgi:hypothetical protein
VKNVIGAEAPQFKFTLGVRQSLTGNVANFFHFAFHAAISKLNFAVLL